MNLATETDAQSASTMPVLMCAPALPDRCRRRHSPPLCVALQVWMPLIDLCTYPKTTPSIQVGIALLGAPSDPWSPQGYLSLAHACRGLKTCRVRCPHTANSHDGWCLLAAVASSRLDAYRCMKTKATKGEAGEIRVAA